MMRVPRQRIAHLRFSSFRLGPSPGWAGVTEIHSDGDPVEFPSLFTS